jgi:hypothetical protein
MTAWPAVMPLDTHPNPDEGAEAGAIRPAERPLAAFAGGAKSQEDKKAA